MLRNGILDLIHDNKITQSFFVYTEANEVSCEIYSEGDTLPQHTSFLYLI